MTNSFRARVRATTEKPAVPETETAVKESKLKAPCGSVLSRLRLGLERFRTSVRRRAAKSKTVSSGPKGREARAPNIGSAVAPGSSSLAQVLAPWRRLGWAVIAVFLGGSVVWASNANLHGAAIGSGVVVVESKRKTIQHLEGGIIDEILVKEGERVEAGQPLVRFNHTHPKAALGLLNGRLLAALASQARLIAERDDAKEITFPDELLQLADDPKVAEIITGEINVLKARRSRISGQESVLKERIQKHRKEIQGLRAQIRAAREQLSLIEEEIGPVEDMVARGIVSKAVLLALKRKRAAISGDIGDYRAQVARAEESINEVELQLKLPETTDHNQVTEELQKVQAEIADLRDKLRAAGDVLERTEVVAPLAGTVVDLKVHTIGGVVQPGQDLLDLVPELDRLIIDVRVDPKDIDVVYPDMPAQVRLTAFNARTTPILEGMLSSVSADRITDPATGDPYFAARVILEAEDSPFDLGRLKPGMQAEVFLVTTERTAMDYLIEPVVRSFARAGREQ